MWTEWHRLAGTLIPTLSFYLYCILDQTGHSGRKKLLFGKYLKYVLELMLRFFCTASKSFIISACLALNISRLFRASSSCGFRAAAQRQVEFLRRKPLLGKILSNQGHIIAGFSCTFVKRLFDQPFKEDKNIWKKPLCFCNISGIEDLKTGEDEKKSLLLFRLSSSFCASSFSSVLLLARDLATTLRSRFFMF